MNRKYRDHTRFFGFWLAFFVVISVFFYVPMNVKASENSEWQSTYTYVSFTDAQLDFYFDDYASNDSVEVSDVGEIVITSQHFSFLEDGKKYKFNSELTTVGIMNDIVLDEDSIYFGSGSYTGKLCDVNGSPTVVCNPDPFIYGSSSDSPFVLNIPIIIECYKGADGIISGSVPASGRVAINLYYKEISTEEYNDLVYQNGYDAGYSAGYETGENSGYNTGYNTGYDVGFADGANSVDTEEYYQNGYDSGYDVGYGTGYDDGFAEGADSVDTEEYYRSGYNDGYSEAYNIGYDAGYEEAYDVGYSTAVQELKTSGVVGGDTTTVSKNIRSNNTINIEDVNTRLPLIYDYYYDSEREISGSWTDHYYEYNLYDTDGDGVVDEVDVDSDWNDSETQYTYDEEIDSGNVSIGYFVDAPTWLFTASEDAYAYKVEVIFSNTSYSSSNVLCSWNIVGTHSDVVDGTAQLGAYVYNGSQLSHTFFVKTDNLPIDIYSGILTHFIDTDSTSANYNLSTRLTVKYTPYSRTEYSQIIQSIDDLKGSVDNLANGYDSSAGESMNESFSASLTEYQTAEDSLFSAAQSGLDSFTFVDFTSYPQLVTAMSFVTSLMTSVFRAMGGESGPAGIVLSVLFSVMLVSMVIGLYRYFQSKGRGGDG